MQQKMNTGVNLVRHNHMEAYVSLWTTETRLSAASVPVSVPVSVAALLEVLAVSKANDANAIPNITRTLGPRSRQMGLAVHSLHIYTG